MDACWAIVPAAGIGKRMAAYRPKQYLELTGETVLACTVRRLAAHASVSGIAIGLVPDDPYWPAVQAGLGDLGKPLHLFRGGGERCDTVRNGLDELARRGYGGAWALVHDAARPCLRAQDVATLIDTVQDRAVDGGILATPVRDTIKQVCDGRVIDRTVPREALWHALTPQMFRIDALHAAIDAALAARVNVTDEASAMEFRGASVMVVEGHADNIKITHPADLVLAEAILAGQNVTR
ncbi:MAG: 2-C-methyl-D-erythritol 4-phosphate cytidylyltransferase [Gammaproteobacteria bacterium]|nr:2-C-methyl-D-erythritol 4-phosphate cytidylyltransferase [Gammaproteobacteria bacterium]